MESYKSPKVENRESSVAGIGLFAKESIAEGEVIYVKSGQVVNFEEAKSISENIGDYYMQIHDDLYLTPLTKEDLAINAIYQNHSCEPNCGPEGQITFVTLRDIKAGEELYYDIAMTTAHTYSFKCNCGSKNCRGVITGKDWQRKDLQERYGQHFSTFILKKINKSKLEQ